MQYTIRLQQRIAVILRPGLSYYYLICSLSTQYNKYNKYHDHASTVEDKITEVNVCQRKT